MTRDGRLAGGNLLVRYTGDSNSRSFVPFNGRLLVEYYCGGMIFDHPDEIGSATTATACTGNLVNEKLYYPFGEFWTGYALPNLGLHQEFAQLPDYDPETDQYNTANRHYSPSGRWLTPDPGGLKFVHLDDPQTWNMYAYVRNNPLDGTDPDGHGELADLWNDFETAAANTFDSVGSGFVVSVLAPDQAIKGAVNSLKTAAQAYGTSEGRAQLGQQLTTDVSTTRQVVFEAILLGGAAVAPGASGRTSEVQTLGNINPATSEVPTEIPAGPSPSPTAAQQRAINQMGDAHGCSTCGATSPGTKSGNWVGDHQDPTALNPSGKPQVYRPQCLNCSRVQGGLVRAAKAALKKKEVSQ
jgi:RHS repeat-associated protein